MRVRVDGKRCAGVGEEAAMDAKWWDCSEECARMRAGDVGVETHYGMPKDEEEMERRRDEDATRDGGGGEKRRRGDGDATRDGEARALQDGGRCRRG